MKGKLITSAVLGAMLVGSNAFATIARQAVLGNQPAFSTLGSATTTTVNTVNGSLWYDDDYNVFYNPAYIMDNKNYVVVQKGFEGGFFKGEFDNFAYGVYVNRGGVGNANAGYGNANLVAPGIRYNTSLNGSAGTAVSTQRPIDFFVGGDTGIKWGLHVGWAYNRDASVATKTAGTTTQPFADAERTARYWRFDLGASVMGLEPFAGATLFSKIQDNTANNVTQNLNDFNVGTRYKYEGWTPYVMYRQYRESGSSGTGLTSIVTGLNVGQRQHRTRIIGGGVGHDTKVADGVHVMKNIGFWYGSTEDDGSTTEYRRDFKRMILPINVALEAEATSWLSLRGGIGYEFIDSVKGANTTAVVGTTLSDRHQSQAGSPTFRIGSTFKFGKLNIDSALGTGGSVTAGTAATLDGTTAGFDAQTFAQISASYRW